MVSIYKKDGIFQFDKSELLDAMMQKQKTAKEYILNQTTGLSKKELILALKEQSCYLYCYPIKWLCHAILKLYTTDKNIMSMINDLVKLVSDNVNQFEQKNRLPVAGAIVFLALKHHEIAISLKEISFLLTTTEKSIRRRIKTIKMIQEELSE